jgi:hypothetical protein
MKSLFKVLMITLIAWSAFAGSIQGLNHTSNQVMIKGTHQVSNSENQQHEAGILRDLRNGDYALACQNEDMTLIPNMYNYIYSPVISLPAGNSVLFDFFIRGSFSGDPDAFPNVDYWGCELTPDGGATWYAISNPYGDPNGSNYVYTDVPGDWSSFVASYTVDGMLDDYAGGDIQFRWYMQTDADPILGEGLFIDDVSVDVDGASAFFADFEDGDLTDWVSVDGTAEPAHFHQTTVGAYSGQSWAMNDPDLGTAGGYADHWYQVLDSPPVTLPDGQVNTLTFQQNRNVEDPAGASNPYNGWDGMNVRISADGGASWEVLTDVTPAYNSTSLYSFGSEFGEGPGIAGWGGSSGGWEAVSFTIPSSYQNLEVMIRFAFASDPAYSTSDAPAMFGWIIDNIDIAGVLTNDGETSEGWVPASNIPIAGDFWHVTFVGSLPVPGGVAAEAGDSQVAVSWADLNESQEVTFSWGDETMESFISSSVPWVAGEVVGSAWAAHYNAAQTTTLHTFSYILSSGNTATPGSILPIIVTVWDGAAQIIYESDPVTADAMDVLQEFDLSPANISVSGGFYVGWAYTDTTAPYVALDSDSEYAGEAYGWHPEGTMLSLTGTGMDGNYALYASGVTTSEGGFTYNVYRRTAGGSFGSPLNAAPLNVPFYTDATALNGVSYYYAVSAIHDGMEGPLSAEVTAMPESQTVVEIAYDDGTAEFGFNIGAGNYQAVKFTPEGYPTLIKRVKVHINDTQASPFIALVWDDNGPSGTPLAEMGRYGWSFPVPGWNTMDLTSDSLWVTGGSVYFGLKELPGAASIGADTDGGYSGNSYFGMTQGDGSITWDNMASLGLEYNLMFRIDVDTAFVQVGIEEFNQGVLPTAYSLEQNYPNPFNPSTAIAYTLPEDGNVELKVFDLSGRQVDVLVQEHQSAGSYRLTLDGSHMSSGIYIYTLSSGNVHLTRKMILLK